MTSDLNALEASASLRTQIADALRASIIAGDMSIGTLYSVPMLADKFGVSITPVREAMLDLAKEGLVVAERNKGFRVRELSDQELDQITEVRLLLEPAAVAGLSGKLDAVQLADLRSLADNIVNTAQQGDVIAYVAADRAFHGRLLELTGNRVLYDTVMTLRAQSRLLGLAHLAQRGVLDQTAHEHHDVIESLAAGDAAAVDRIVRQHLGHVRSDWAGRD